MFRLPCGRAKVEDNMVQAVKVQAGDRFLEVIATISGDVHGQFHQFTENAVDAVEDADRLDGVIQIELQRPSGRGTGRRGRPPVECIVIRDNGIGMSVADMRRVVSSVGDSDKIDKMLRGEKGVGIWAFANLAQEVHLSSRKTAPEGSACLVLKREWLRTRDAQIYAPPHLCPQGHEKYGVGTDVYLIGLMPEAADKLRKEEIKKRIGRTFGPDLRANKFGISIRDGGGYESIDPIRFRGIENIKQAFVLKTGGRVLIELYGLSKPTEGTQVTLLGRAGSRICAIDDLEDFRKPPWSDRRLEGGIRYDGLLRTAAKIGVVEDERYRQLREALQAIEPKIASALDSISSEQAEKDLKEVLNKVRQLILELASRLDIMLPTEATVESGETGELIGTPDPVERVPGGSRSGGSGGRPTVSVVTPGRDGHRATRIETPQLIPAAPPQGKEALHSWYDEIERTIYVNEQHRDYLEAREDTLRLGRYCTHIWIKEVVLHHYGKGDAEQVSDEMVGILAQAEGLFRKYF